MSNNTCEDNEKFKILVDDNFDITHADTDRMQQDEFLEFLEMHNCHCKCNYSWSSVLTFLTRLGINFIRGARKIINGAPTNISCRNQTKGSEVRRRVCGRHERHIKK